MSTEQELQRAKPTPLLVKPPIKEPFKPEPPDLFSSKHADQLSKLIPAMGAELPAIYPAPPPPLRVEEQYEPSERAALPSTTTDKTYKILTPDPKQILLVAETQDHIVEFNRVTDSDSLKIFAKGSLAMTGKGITEIHYKAATATGTLYVRVWKA